MFLSVWNTLANTKKDYWKYYPQAKKEIFSSAYLVYGDNPLNNTRISENLFCSLIDQAKKSIDIYTPYFIPTKKLIQSFIGVKKKKGQNYHNCTRNSRQKNNLLFNQTICTFFKR